jgi:hypothetical protein
MDNSQGWQIFADRFIWSDETALSLIPQEVTEEEIQKYLYTFHGDTISLEEIREFRKMSKEESTRKENLS